MNASPRRSFADGVLKASAALWFAAAAGGQLLFAFYAARFYGGAAAEGDLHRWNKILLHGIVDGDTAGNAVVIAHIIAAVILTAGGALQLIPFVRNRFPKFHRFNGRTFLVAALAASIGGLYLVWTRGVLGGFVNQAAISFNAVLIIACALAAYRFARAGRFDIHQQWATRLYLVVNGVWFFRIFLSLWIVINQAPVGLGKELDGPVAIFLAYAQYAVPLAVYEAYRLAAGGSNGVAKFAMAAALVVAAALTGAGSAAAYLILWGPRL